MRNLKEKLHRRDAKIAEMNLKLTPTRKNARNIKRRITYKGKQHTPTPSKSEAALRESLAESENAVMQLQEELEDLSQQTPTPTPVALIEGNLYYLYQ